MMIAFFLDAITHIENDIYLFQMALQTLLLLVVRSQIPPFEGLMV
jgi:hypothetical protein